MHCFKDGFYGTMHQKIFSSSTNIVGDNIVGRLIKRKQVKCSNVLNVDKGDCLFKCCINVSLIILRLCTCRKDCVL